MARELHRNSQMPRVATQRFGTLDYDQAHEIRFPNGLPGFEQQRRFLLVEQPTFAPLVFLQSLEAVGPCFIALPIGVIDSHYELPLSEEDAALLTPSGPSDLLSLAILTAPGDSPPTANLLAPVVVNLAARVGVQVVRADTKYSHCHPVGGPCS